jgi:hypothetical protein
MSVADCLGRLLATGRISRDVASQALDLHKRMQQEFTRDVPPATADAAAALAAAKALRKSAAEKANNISNQVRAFQEGETRLAEHPMGRMAALAGMLSRDLWRDAKAFRDLPASSPVKSGANVDYKYRSIGNWLYNKFGEGMKAFKPGFTGLSKDQLIGIDNFIREQFGVDTGDALAKGVSKGWTDAVDSGVARAQQGGKIFTPLDDWRLPQEWRSWRVKDIGLPEFKRDTLEAVNAGALKLFDRDTGRPVTAANTDFIINRAFADITGSGGASAPFTREQRTFNFQQGQAGAEAYMRLMRKYGWGENFMQAVTGHLDRMAHEISLIETFGPSYEASFRALFKQARADPGIPVVEGVERWNPARLAARWIESKGVVEGMWKVLNGQVHATHDDFTSNLIGAMRNMNVASSLRQAIFAVAPTDAVTSVLASNHVGMGGFNQIGKLLTGGISKDEAAHLNIQSHGMMDYANGLRDYENHISVMQTTAKIASAMTKATGLDQWGQMGKRTWAGNMLNLFSQESGREFAAVNPRFRQFLEAYGFTPAEWDRMRDPALHINLDGARYLSPDLLSQADRGLYDRLMSSIQEQGAFAMHQPDVRLRSIETGAAWGVGPGKGQEIVRSLMQFKTFALSRISTQMMRVLIDGPLENRIMRGLAFMTASTAAGALSIQTKQIINGKDPLPMSHPKFWGDALRVGGVGGIYTDILESAMRGSRGAGDVFTSLAGPLAQAGADVLRLAVSPLREQFDEETRTGHRTTVGRQAVSMLRRNTPNTWYTRLAVDRLMWDKLQTLVDPDYRGSFRRAEQRLRKEGTGFWWSPGESSPERGPDISGTFRR